MAEFGTPESLDALHNQPHRIIGFDNSKRYINNAENSGRSLSKMNFILRTDSYQMQLNLARAKAGVTVTFVDIAEQYSELVQLFSEADIESVEWWLVCHRDVHVNPRIRCLMTFLRQWFQAEGQ
ncbi:LysR substrate-binding domain-containing protein [Photobacterium sagamiensis]